MEFNAYQDRIMTLQNELNYECANTEKLCAALAVAAAVPGQHLHVQLASIADPERFDGS
jgi:hypothetical protein